MWIDVHEDQSCHIGIDELLARVSSPIERLTFPPTRGLERPSVVLTISCGLELPLVFPWLMEIQATNLELRGTPKALRTDPYGRGWLYHARLRGDQNASVSLVRGADAQNWLQQEHLRLILFSHDLLARNRSDRDLGPTLADGGPAGPRPATPTLRGILRRIKSDTILATCIGLDTALAPESDIMFRL
jgi:glycine cleavage system H lipoate-binding protein